MEIIHNFKRILTRSQKIHLGYLVGLVVLSALMEIGSVGSIMPFMGLVMTPTLAMKNPILHSLYYHFGFTNFNHFLLLIGFLVLAIILMTNFLGALTSWIIIRFSFNIGAYLSKMLFAGYLKHPYSFFLDRNSSELVQNILWEMGRVVMGVLIPFLTALSRIVVVFFILIFLVWMNPIMALTMGIALGGAYTIIYLAVRKTLARIGTEISKENILRNQFAQETLGCIKDVKLLGREEEFFGMFSNPIDRYSQYISKSQMITLLPRYLLETFAFGGMLSIMLILIMTRHDVSHVLPLMALYALAGYRLMPALQQTFSNLSTIRFNITSVDRIMHDLPDFSFQQTGIPTLSSPRKDPIPFQNTLVLDDVSFSYASRPSPILKNISLTIRSNTTVGIVGSTGSGKTTLLDIILGLLTPTGGSLIVDGTRITSENVRSWQGNIGYVPQQIMLLDNTITRNIAFGVPDDEIDHARVKFAAIQANLIDLIENTLPDHYETFIGERGIRLSGGQRQRIGIARALYHNPSILVFDEATSALDTLTEEAIMEAIQQLSRSKTILMVAHRLSTIRTCDFVYFLDQGKILDQGTYSELCSRNELFRRMAKENQKPDSDCVPVPCGEAFETEEKL